MVAGLANGWTDPQGRTQKLAPLNAWFLSWWNGAEPEHRPKTENRQTDTGVERDLDHILPWDPSHLAAMEAVWGEGFTVPGGEKFARKVLAVLGLSPKKSVLELCPGLGGTARTLTQQNGLWMDAFEPIEKLAIAGHQRSITAGLSKRAPITPVSLETLQLKPKRYDAIYSRERLFMVEDKQRLLDQCAEGLKPHGQMVITDLVARDSNSDAALNPAIVRRGEDAHFWTDAQYQKELTAREFTVHLARDITGEYLDLIHEAWVRTPGAVKATPVSPDIGDLIVEEGEVWQARWRALSDGELSVMRYDTQIGRLG